MPTALTDFEGNKGDSFSQASEKCGLLVVICTGDCVCSPKSRQTRPLTLLSGLKSGYAHIHRVAVKVFVRGRDLCI